MPYALGVHGNQKESNSPRAGVIDCCKLLIMSVGNVTEFLCKCWRDDDSVVNNIYYSCRGPDFDSQHPHGIAHNVL